MGSATSVRARAGAALAAGLLGAVAWIAVDASPAPAALSISLSPSSGPPGTTVTVSGSAHCQPGSIQVSFQGFGVVASAGPNSSLPISFTVPGAASPGSYGVQVSVHNPPSSVQCFDSGEAAFTVTAPPPPTPTPVPPPPAPPPPRGTVTTTTTTTTTAPPVLPPAPATTTTTTTPLVPIRVRLTSSSHGATSAFVILVFFLLIGVGVYELRRSFE